MQISGDLKFHCSWENGQKGRSTLINKQWLLVCLETWKQDWRTGDRKVRRRACGRSSCNGRRECGCLCPVWALIKGYPLERRLRIRGTRPAVPRRSVSLFPQPPQCLVRDSDSLDNVRLPLMKAALAATTAESLNCQQQRQMLGIQ